MTQITNCPKCNSANTYEYLGIYTCPDCAHEFSLTTNENTEDEKKIICDVNGVQLLDGDTVTVIKDLKVRGSSVVVKMGTKVKNIRLAQGDHDIDCKIPGIGAMGLKSEFVKKV